MGKLLNRLLGVLPLSTGLVGLLWLIYENGVNGVGVGDNLMAIFITIGIFVFGMMFFLGLGMITYGTDDGKKNALSEKRGEK